MAKPSNAEQKASAALDALQTGETLLVAVWKTKDPNKVQLEFAEKTRQMDNNPGALLALMNADDPRFSSGARRAWLTSSIGQVGKLFNINTGEDAEWEAVEQRGGKEGIFLGLKNPTALGKRVRVIIQETTEPTEYQAENLETSAKRKGADGDYIMSGGKHIFSNTDVVLLDEGVEVEHVLLQPDTATKSVGDKITNEVEEA